MPLAGVPVSGRQVGPHPVPGFRANRFSGRVAATCASAGGRTTQEAYDEPARMMRTPAWQFDLSGIDVDRAIRMERVTVPHLHIGLRAPGRALAGRGYPVFRAVADGSAGWQVLTCVSVSRYAATL